MSKTPKLRFKEFSGDWEEKKLGNYLIQYTDITTVNNQYPPLTSSRRGIFLQEEYFNKQVASKDNTGYNIVPRNYFTYRHMSDDSIFYFNINSIVDYGIVSTLYPVFTTDKSKLNSNYLKEYLNESDRFRKYSVLQKQGGSRTYMYFSKLKEFMMPIPKIEEQEKIASFFSLIDDKISLQGEKVEALKDYKRGMMQKIFSRELRFKDDDGRDYPEWEEKKLGDIANITMGQSPSSSCYNEEYIGLPLIQGNADVKDRKTEPRVYTSEITKTCDIGDIIMSVRAPVGAISMSLHNACIGRGVCSIKPKYSVEYVYQFLLKYESKWSQVSQGSTFESVNSNDIKSLKIPFPNLDEQKKIGSFLGNIDNKIEKEQEKLDYLNDYKKGLLQQMFV